MARKNNKTIDKDLGAEELMAEARAAKGAFVTIGVHQEEGGEAYPDSQATVAEVAFWNEFGTITAPERSFIRSTVDENQKVLEAMTAKLLSDVLAGKLTTKMALDKIGFRIQELIKKKILELNDPKNAPSTIARKGFNNPLVDSRRLWRSIAFETVLKPGLLKRSKSA